jgi:hypothetical protein
MATLTCKLCSAAIAAADAILTHGYPLRRCRPCHRKIVADTARRNRSRYRDAETHAVARARVLFRAAVQSGAIVREPCEACGAEKADGHHDDYAHPLTVRWLCRRCHKAWHAANGPGRNRDIAVTDWPQRGGPGRPSTRWPLALARTEDA